MSKSTSSIILYGWVRNISLALLLTLPCIPVQAENFNRFTDELTQHLETDALSVMARGFTFETEASLCKRIPGPTGQEFQLEYSAWRIRNEEFFSTATHVLNEIGNQFLPEGGEPAKQGYFRNVAAASANAAMKRVSRELGGANLDNNIAPPEQVCSGFAKMLHNGIVDYKNTPEATRALLPYMQRTKKSP